MEIIRFLINYFIKSYNGNFAPLLKLLSDNGFDVSNLINNLSLDSIEPIVEMIMKKNAKENPTENSDRIMGLEPVKNIADEKIVEVLNGYFSS